MEHVFSLVSFMFGVTGDRGPIKCAELLFQHLNINRVYTGLSISSFLFWARELFLVICLFISFRVYGIKGILHLQWLKDTI